MDNGNIHLLSSVSSLTKESLISEHTDIQGGCSVPLLHRMIMLNIGFNRSTSRCLWLLSTKQPVSGMHFPSTLQIQNSTDFLGRILNVGDLKPYEREIEFFITYGWNSTRWTADNLDSFVSSWAQREFGVNQAEAQIVTDIVANLTRFNARRKPELLNSTTYSLINYRECVNI